LSTLLVGFFVRQAGRLSPSNVPRIAALAFDRRPSRSSSACATVRSDSRPPRPTMSRRRGTPMSAAKAKRLRVFHPVRQCLVTNVAHSLFEEAFLV
jgi:hypothetical protein